jgi:hypothetical protein
MYVFEASLPMISRLGSGGATSTSICKRLWAPAVVVKIAMIAAAMDTKTRPCLLSVPMAAILPWTPSLAVWFLGKLINWRNQAITLKCPAQRHDECNGDITPAICGPLAIQTERATLLNRRPTVVWVKSDSSAMRSLVWLSSSMATISKGAANKVAPSFSFLQITDALAFSALWSRVTLQGQSLCRGLGAGSPATQGIALRYS